MFAQRTARNILDIMTGQTAIFTGPIAAYVALFTTAPTADDGSGAAEVTAASYGRIQGTFGAPSIGSDPTTCSNSATVQFAAVPQGQNWGSIVAFGLYDAATGGNLIAWDWLGNYAWQPFTVNNNATAAFTVGAGYANGNAVVITSTLFGGTPPTYSAGSPAANTVLNVTGASGVTFNLQNGATTLGTSSTGSGMIRQVWGTGASPGQSIPGGVQASFGVGQLVLSAV
jgi:hypothetical protein